MIALTLTILLTITLFICFKEFSKRNINTHQAITFNYLTASFLAYLLYKEPIHIDTITTSKWIVPTIFLGILFIVMFNIMAKTTQKLGISIASMTSKISLIIPVLGAFLLKESTEFSYINGIGVFIALIAIYLVFKKDYKINHPITIAVFLFFGSGILDMSLSYIQNNLLINSGDSNLFIIVVFFVAFLSGLIKTAFSKSKINYRNILAGIYLGIPNYFSIYFVLLSLDKLGGMVVFPILNIGVVILSSIISFMFYKEYLSKLNWIGIGLACISIILILVF